MLVLLIPEHSRARFGFVIRMHFTMGSDFDQPGDYACFYCVGMYLGTCIPHAPDGATNCQVLDARTTPKGPSLATAITEAILTGHMLKALSYNGMKSISTYRKCTWLQLLALVSMAIGTVAFEARCLVYRRSCTT